MTPTLSHNSTSLAAWYGNSSRQSTHLNGTNFILLTIPYSETESQCNFIETQGTNLSRQTYNNLPNTQQTQLLGDLAGERLLVPRRDLERKAMERRDCHLSTREGQQEFNRVLLVFF